MPTTEIKNPIDQMMETCEPDNRFIASAAPIEDLKKLSYPGQNPTRQLYRAGYEHFFNEMPKISDNDIFTDSKHNQLLLIFAALKVQILKDGWWKEVPLTPGDFVSRVILALEKPTVGKDGELRGGAEILVTRWAQGAIIPIHSHAAGFMHEEMIQGAWTETEYRVILDDRTRKTKYVRPTKTETFVTGDVISDMYTKHDPDDEFPALIHSALVKEETFAIHFIPAHPRDGRDNTNYLLESEINGDFAF